jgi:hypothetical protein
MPGMQNFAVGYFKEKTSRIIELGTISIFAYQF